MSPNPVYYSIPSQLRRMENMHILFWLLKDISWCLNFKVLGVLMKYPSTYFSVEKEHAYNELQKRTDLIVYNKDLKPWMICEFTGIDETPIIGGFDGRHLALIPFSIGLFILLYYYIFLRHKEKSEDHPLTM